MIQATPQPNPLPSFQRPSEAVVYYTLENLCQEAGGPCQLTFSELARHCGLAQSTIKRAVHDLSKRRIIRFRPGTNQHQPSLYAISTGRGAGVSQSKRAGLKIGRPIPSDKYSNTNTLHISINDSDRAVVHRRREDGDRPSEDRLADQIAEGLDDLKNLKLYQSYCRRFPAEIILKAYVRAKEPAREKIRKSRGALFNFLVQLYAKHTNKNDHPGPASR